MKWFLQEWVCNPSTRVFFRYTHKYLCDSFTSVGLYMILTIRGDLWETPTCSVYKQLAKTEDLVSYYPNKITRHAFFGMSRAPTVFKSLESTKAIFFRLRSIVLW